MIYHLLTSLLHKTNILRFILRIPFHRYGVAFGALLRAESILDVGVRYAFAAKMIKHLGSKKRLLGVDIWLPNLLREDVRMAYDDLVLCDARHLPFRTNSVNVVLMFEIIEHMVKQDAFKCIQYAELVAKDEVIISTPVGYFKQEEMYGNPYESHKSAFVPSELRELGYKVRGIGLRAVSRTKGGIPITSSTMRMISLLISLLFWPLPYFRPEVAERMIGMKSLKRHEWLKRTIAHD
jgi:SAM-dependent methyltransferase